MNTQRVGQAKESAQRLFEELLLEVQKLKSVKAKSLKILREGSVSFSGFGPELHLDNCTAKRNDSMKRPVAKRSNAIAERAKR